MTAPVRTCIGCGQSDDHPRHTIALPDGNDVHWHHDCHALATGCATCAATVDSAGGVIGDELREHITSGGAADAVTAATADALLSGKEH